MGYTWNDSLMRLTALAEIPHPCDSAERGGISSMLLVSDVCSTARGHVP